MPKLSVTVITKNEEADIAEALHSVRWADELIVVDASSTDDTATIAKQLAHRVVVRDWPGFAAQKNYAASIASHDWILSIDADERVTPALADEIRTVLSGPATHAAYRMPRLTWHLGRWMRSTDWYPDRQLRLYNRRAARWVGRHVHEAVAVDGTIGTLQGELWHFAYRDIAEHLDTIERYTDLAARQMNEDGRRASTLQIVANPALAFLRNYILRGGFRDGVPGLVVSVMNAYYVFLKFAKLWELQHARARVSDAEADRRNLPT